MSSIAPLQIGGRVELPLGYGPLPLHKYLQPLEGSNYMDEVGHQRQLNPLPEGSMSQPSSCPSGFYGLRQEAMKSESLMQVLHDSLALAGDDTLDTPEGSLYWKAAIPTLLQPAYFLGAFGSGSQAGRSIDDFSLAASVEGGGQLRVHPEDSLARRYFESLEGSAGGPVGAMGQLHTSVALHYVTIVSTTVPRDTSALPGATDPAASIAKAVKQECQRLGGGHTVKHLDLRMGPRLGNSDNAFGSGDAFLADAVTKRAYDCIHADILADLSAKATGSQAAAHGRVYIVSGLDALVAASYGQGSHMPTTSLASLHAVTSLLWALSSLLRHLNQYRLKDAKTLRPSQDSAAPTLLDLLHEAADGWALRFVVVLPPSHSTVLAGRISSHVSTKFRVSAAAVAVPLDQSCFPSVVTIAKEGMPVQVALGDLAHKTASADGLSLSPAWLDAAVEATAERLVTIHNAHYDALLADVQEDRAGDDAGIAFVEMKEIEEVVTSSPSDDLPFVGAVIRKQPIVLVVVPSSNDSQLQASLANRYTSIPVHALSLRSLLYQIAVAQESAAQEPIKATLENLLDKLCGGEGSDRPPVTFLTVTADEARCGIRDMSTAGDLITWRTFDSLFAFSGDLLHQQLRPSSVSSSFCLEGQQIAMWSANRLVQQVFPNLQDGSSWTFSRPVEEHNMLLGDDAPSDVGANGMGISSTMRIILPKWEVSTSTGETSSTFDSLISPIEDPKPLDTLESMMLATSCSSGQAAHSDGPVRRQLAMLMLAWARRLRCGDSEIQMATARNREWKAKAKEANQQRKLRLAKMRKQQEGGGLEPIVEPTEPQSAFADFSAGLTSEATIGSLFVSSDAMLDMMLIENPLTLSAGEEGKLTAKGWVGDAIYYLAHSGLITPIRCVQNPLQMLPPFLKASERRSRLIAAAFTKVQERQRHEQKGCIVEGITCTAWGGAFTPQLDARISAQGIVLLSAAFVLSPLGRRVSSLLLPQTLRASKSPAPTGMGLVHATHALHHHAFGLPLTSFFAASGQHYSNVGRKSIAEVVARDLRRLLLVPVTSAMVQAMLLEGSPAADGSPLQRIGRCMAHYPSSTPSEWGEALIASAYCERQRLVEVEKMLATGSSGGADKPSQPLRLPSRGWLTEAAPIIAPEGINGANTDEADDDLDEALSEAERAAIKLRKKNAKAAKESIKQQLATASVAFSTKKKMSKKHRPERELGAEPEDKYRRIPSRMTPIGMSVEVDPSLPNSEYLLAAQEQRYPSMVRELCVLTVADPFSNFISRSNYAIPSSCATTTVATSNYLVVLRLVLRNALNNLCVTLEQPPCLSSPNGFVSPVLDAIEPTIRRHVSKQRGFTMSSALGLGGEAGGGDPTTVLGITLMLPEDCNNSFTSVTSQILDRYFKDAQENSTAAAHIASLCASCFCLPVALSGDASADLPTTFMALLDSLRPPSEGQQDKAGGLWLDAMMALAEAPVPTPPPAATHTTYSNMLSYSGLCAHTEFRRHGGIIDVIASKKQEEKRLAERRLQAAREAAVKMSGGTLEGAAEVKATEFERSLVNKAVALVKTKGRAVFEKEFRGRPSFEFIEEGNRLHGFYVYTLMLQDAA